MSLQQDMCTYFINAGLVTGFGIDCFEDYIPEAPDNVVVLYEYAGDPHNAFTDVEHRSIQVIVRNEDQAEAKALAIRLYKSLQSDNLIINFTQLRFGQVHLRQTPFKLNTDKNNRSTYCFNIGITTTCD